MAAAAPVPPLALELPFATLAALKQQKKKKKKKEERKIKEYGRKFIEDFPAESRYLDLKYSVLSYVIFLFSF